MNQMRQDELEQYYAEAESWSADRQRTADRSRRFAWIAAGVAGGIAVLEAVALVLLIPLGREVPYTLLVDRQTGHVEALRPLEESRVTPDSALTRSFLVQYVAAREGFDAGLIQANYRKAALMSAGEARNQYLAQMRSNSSANPLVSLPVGSAIAVEIRSISSLSADTAMVRFDTVRTDRGGQPQLAQNWAAVITYRYNQAEMSAADRLDNPLGFQVVRYRRDPETLPEVLPETLPVARDLALPPGPTEAMRRPDPVPEPVR